MNLFRLVPKLYKKKDHVVLFRTNTYLLVRISSYLLKKYQFIVRTLFHWLESLFLCDVVLIYFVSLVLFSLPICPTVGGYLRVHGGTDHRTGDHCPAGLGGRSSRSQLLVDGVQEAAEVQWSPAPSPWVPQSPVCAPGHTVRADQGLLEQKT